MSHPSFHAVLHLFSLSTFVSLMIVINGRFHMRLGETKVIPKKPQSRAGTAAPANNVTSTANANATTNAIAPATVISAAIGKGAVPSSDAEKQPSIIADSDNKLNSEAPIEVALTVSR
jgi:hypothetical protein